jgi:ribose/xylose/arabinose/galactoside ABC-type transport system permease subunit
MKISRFRLFLRSKIFQLLFLCILVVVITLITAPNAYNKANLKQIMTTITVYAVFVCGVAPLLMCGGFDFAGSAFATCAMLAFARLLELFPGVPWPVMLIPLIIVGGVLGALNAFFVIKINLIAFIATMAMATIFQGIATWSVKGVSIQVTNKGFTNLSAAYILDIIPVFFVVAAILVLLYSIMLMRTSYGRSILMCGGNPNAARLAGLNPNRIRTVLYINSGVIAAIAGGIWAAQNRMASPLAFQATQPHMRVFIGALLGGVSFFGGSGSLGGAFLGVALINLLAYSLQTMGVDIWINGLINGMLLIVALTIDDVSRRLRMRKLGIKAGGGNGIVMPGMSK